jgi:hypothetical protein
LVKQALLGSKNMSDQIAKAAVAPVLTLRFKGKGPTLVQEGQYNEIARTVPSESGHVDAPIRKAQFTLAPKCGFERSGRATLVTLCDASVNKDALQVTQNFDAFELWSSTYQATSMMGRHFERVLNGRAQFKEKAETVALVSAVVSGVLLTEGLSQMGRCRNSSCSQASGALVGAGLIAGAIAGISFLVSKSQNPEADVRYVPSLFESGYLLVGT